MFELDIAVGGELANSYADLEYADLYWDSHWSADKKAQWQALADEAKSLLLIQACQIIDSAKFTDSEQNSSLYRLYWDANLQQFRSVATTPRALTKYHDYQALQFPRTCDTRRDGTLFVPDNIKMAQCEQAVYLINFDESVIASALQGLVSESVSAGGVSTNQAFRAGGTMYAPVAKTLVTKFLIKSSGRWERA